MSSLYLRISAPIQSWALLRTTGNIVDTKEFPTWSGLTGMIAASLGYYRNQWESWIYNLCFVLRVEQPGIIEREFQTINPRDEDALFQRKLYRIFSDTKTPQQIVFTPNNRKITSIVRRTYLSDATFILEIVLPEDYDHQQQLVDAFTKPVFSPYLGKKAFVPTYPFVLGVGASGLLGNQATAHVIEGKRCVLPHLAVATKQYKRRAMGFDFDQDFPAPDETPYSNEFYTPSSCKAALGTPKPLRILELDRHATKQAEVYRVPTLVEASPDDKTGKAAWLNCVRALLNESCTADIHG